MHRNVRKFEKQSPRDPAPPFAAGVEEADAGGRKKTLRLRKNPQSPPSVSRDQWQAVVNTFDENKNGTLDGEEIVRLYKAMDAGLVGDLPITRLRSALLRDSKTRRAGRNNLQNYDLDYDDRLSQEELDRFRKARAAGEPPP